MPLNSSVVDARNARAAELLDEAEILACFARSDAAALRSTALRPILRLVRTLRVPLISRRGSAAKHADILVMNTNRHGANVKRRHDRQPTNRHGVSVKLQYDGKPTKSRREVRGNALNDEGRFDLEQGGRDGTAVSRRWEKRRPCLARIDRCQRVTGSGLGR